MRLNENTAICTSKVLLVPYDPHHVPRYHEWMEDAAIREATASERLTLAEEHENQVSWREAPDKLTFIICEPLPPEDHLPLTSRDGAAVIAGLVDEPSRMVGDINLFLTRWDEDGEAPDLDDEAADGSEHGPERNYVSAEVDVMVADAARRGRGLGRAAVTAFLRYIRRNLDAVLAEYAGADDPAAGRPVLRDVVAKINAGNQGSIALFKGLGFRQRGDVNYFGEVLMVLEGFGGERTGMEEEQDGVADWGAEGWREVGYDRSQLKE